MLPRGRRVAVFVAAALLAAGAIALATGVARTHHSRSRANGDDEALLRESLHLPTAVLTDPFPLDARVRTYDTRHERGLSGMIAFERAPTARERLSDGHEYVVVETRAVAHNSGARRVVSREWVRAADDDPRGPGVYCRRRQEGPLVCELDPPQPLILTPLVVGRRWTWTGRAGGRASEAKSVVLARERVTVGAGTFEQAWRIDTETHATEGLAETVRRSLWLVEGLGLVEERSTIALEGRATLELDAVLIEARP